MFKKLFFASLAMATALSFGSVGAAKAEMMMHHHMSMHEKMMMKKKMMMREHMMHHHMMHKSM